MSAEKFIQMLVRGETAQWVSTPLATFEQIGRPDLLIAALALEGNFERALALSHQIEKTDQTGVVSFFLSIGFSRSGRSQQALNCITNLDSLSNHGLVEFYREQSRGFYSFNHGDGARAVTHARAALAAAELSQDPLQPLALIYSLDLLGHSLIRTGECRQGLKILRLARGTALQNRHTTFNHAVSISILKYEALFGLEPTRVVSRLYRALVELQPNDSYSRSELRLELARQLILRGQLREARRHLEAAASDILGSHNQLQTAVLYLRLAWMAKLEHRLEDALLALQSAEISLGFDKSDGTTNRELFRKIAYFRLDLFACLERTDEAFALEKKLESFGGSRVLAGIEARMFARRKLNFSNGSTMHDLRVNGEDPFGDLMDRIKKSSAHQAAELLELGYYGLLLPLFGLKLSHTAIVLDVPGGRVIVLDGGEVRIVQSGLRGLLGRLIARLALGSCTRREVIEIVWGYEYESARHDRLISVAISRVQKILGGRQRWIEVSGDRLSLREHSTLKFWAREMRSTSQPVNLQNVNRLHRGLRIRQLQVLDDLATGRDVSVADLVDRFGISRAAALRDLNELVELGFSVRSGKTRATRYLMREHYESIRKE